jgi:ADP-heptose:LPS heptosyltransferase
LTYQRLNRKKLLVGFVLRNVLELPIFFRSRADIVSKPTKKHAVIYESDFFGDLISSLPLIEYLSKEYDKITVITRDGLNAEFCKQYGVNVVGLDLPYKKDNFLAWWLKIYRSRIKISNIFDNCDVYETRGDLRNFLILSAIRYSTLFSFNLTIPRYKGVKLYQWPTNFSLWKTKCTLAQNVFKRDLNLADVQKIIRSSIISDNTKDQREATLNIFYHPGASQRHKRLTNKSSAELIEYLSKFGNVKSNLGHTI